MYKKCTEGGCKVLQMWETVIVTVIWESICQTHDEYCLPKFHLFQGSKPWTEARRDQPTWEDTPSSLWELILVRLLIEIYFSFLYFYSGWRRFYFIILIERESKVWFDDRCHRRWRQSLLKNAEILTASTGLTIMTNAGWTWAMSQVLFSALTNVHSFISHESSSFTIVPIYTW